MTTRRRRHLSSSISHTSIQQSPGEMGRRGKKVCSSWEKGHMRGRTADMCREDSRKQSGEAGRKESADRRQEDVKTRDSRLEAGWQGAGGRIPSTLTANQGRANRKCCPISGAARNDEKRSRSRRKHKGNCRIPRQKK